MSLGSGDKLGPEVLLGEALEYRRGAASWAGDKGSRLEDIRAYYSAAAILKFWMRGHVFLFCSGLVWVWEQGGLSGLGVARLTAILPPKLIFCPIYHLAAHLHWYFPLNLCILNNPFLKKIIHLAALGLCCCPWAFFSCGCPSLERGLSNCGAQAQAACGIFPEQGSNLCPLCWHADS